MAEEHRSGLSEDEVEELARKVMGVICREWPKLRGGLDSSVIYTRLIEEGVDPPDYAMHDALKRLDGWFITPYLGRRSEDQIRVHGGMRIGGVNTSLCDEVKARRGAHRAASLVEEDVRWLRR